MKEQVSVDCNSCEFFKKRNHYKCPECGKQLHELMYITIAEYERLKGHDPEKRDRFNPTFSDFSVERLKRLEENVKKYSKRIRKILQHIKNNPSKYHDPGTSLAYRLDQLELLESLCDEPMD